MNQVEFEKDRRETQEKSETTKNTPSFEISELEQLFKKSLEKIMIFSKQNENQETLMNEITNLLKECSLLFEKIITKSTEDDSIIIEAVTNDIGKYMQIILRLLEENNNFIKGLFFLEKSIKQLQEMILKLKSKLFAKVFFQKIIFQFI